VQLDNLAAAGALMQPVNILGNDARQPVLRFKPGQIGMGGRGPVPAQSCQKAAI
jgi:hypothetical protein